MERGRDADLGTLKASLAKRGVNSRGWRLYLDYGDAIFERLGPVWVSTSKAYSSTANAIVFLCLLQACEMDVLPPPSLVESMLHWQIPDQRLSLVPASFFRAAWKHCIATEYAGEPLAALLENMIIPLAQWFFKSGLHINPDPNLMKTGWVGLERRFQEWRSNQGMSIGAPEWVTPVSSVYFGNCHFVVLTSAADLRAEGAAMRHCIGNYAKRCKETTLRAYSVRQRKGDVILATLTVLYDQTRQHWNLDEINGPANAEVEPYILRNTIGLLHSLDAATANDAKLRAHLCSLRAMRLQRDVADIEIPEF